jgi:predicted site-specific integrase-resolvase
MKKLSQYAALHGVTYRTAWNRYRSGKIPNARMDNTGHVIIDDTKSSVPDKTAVYARVSSSENKTNLSSQSKRVQEFCSAKGWVISVVVEECGSGLNDSRAKLLKLLTDPTITRIVVEHKDRLTRFGFNYLTTLWKGEIVIINEVIEDEKDLMQDFVSLVTSFTARLYGKRRSKRNTEKLIKELQSDS